MSSNIPWTTNYQYEGTFSGASTVNSENSWNRPAVNTPQTNPASWPQLGSATTEAEQQPTSMAQPQLPTISSQEDSGWTVVTANVNNNTSASETDPNSGSAWGRMPNNNITTSTTGWGAPTNSWGQQQSAVDDGTAVWGKSNSNQQSQSNWGGQVSQDNETTANAWGVSEAASASNMHNHEATTQFSNNQQSTLPNSSQSNSTIQPVSWAKAASAGLPTNNSGNETSTEKERETAGTEVPALVPPTPPVTEPDPVQDLVNSHEGWGKKPIQQGTGWNITDGGVGRSAHPVINNGTEAWGRPAGVQIPPSPGWSETINKPGAGRGGNYNQPAGPGQGWGSASMQQTPRPYTSNNAPGWSHSQPQSSSMNSGRWGEMPNQLSSAQTGWGGPPSLQHPSGNSSWGGLQSPTDNSSALSWGNVPPSRPVQQPGSSWGNNMIPQSPGNDQPQWGQSAEVRRPSTIDDGTSAWGDPGTYSKVNMWDHRGKGPMGHDGMGGQMPTPSGNFEPKGWGVPVQSGQPTNRPPSPKGWGDVSPTRLIDNGTSGWGQKPMSGEKWDRGSGMGNWNTGKPSPGNWGQSNDQQWAPVDNGPNWSQPMGKMDNMMKNNMDYSPRGMIPPQPNMNQQAMLRNQMPPVPPQLQNQFHQIRHAVRNGVIPPQVLNPQLMTPQHMHALMQLVNKVSEFQKMQMQRNLLAQNKNIPPMVRQQQMEHCSRLLQQCQQHVEAQRGSIMQSMMQKTQPNMANTNSSMGGMDLGGMRGGGGQSMMSPLNNMGAMGQALPSTMPLTNMQTPNMREQSRLLNSWKQPNPMSGMGDNQQLNFSPMGFNNMGDSMMNGMGYRSPQDDLQGCGDMGIGSNIMGNMPTSVVPNELLPSALPTSPSEQTPSLADIGPPEFTPGVPWKGLKHIDPESDPNITPGSVASAKTMSVNTVRDVDQVLKRERSALSESSTGALPTTIDEDATSPTQSAASIATEGLSSSAWSTGVNTTATVNTVSNTPSALSRELWRVPLTSQSLSTNQSSAFRPAKELTPPWDRSSSSSLWDQSQSGRNQQGLAWGGPSPDNRGSWVVLTNFSAQVDVSGVQQLCRQQGSMVSFQPFFPMESMALVKYSSPDDAANAKKSLNMCMAGSTMLVATVATEQEVTNLVAATAGDPLASRGGNGNRFNSAGAGSTGGFMTQPAQRPPMGSDMGGSSLPGGPGQQFWNSVTSSNIPSSHSWPTNVSPNVAWSGATGEDTSRIMSPMHSLLPENLLGGSEPM